MTFLNTLLRRLRGQPRLVREVAADIARLRTELWAIRKARLQQALRHDAIAIAAKAEAEAALIALNEPSAPAESDTQLTLPLNPSA